MKKRLICILSILLFSFIISLLFEVLVINNKVLNKKSISNPVIVDTSNIEEKDGKYYTTSKNAYIVVKVDSYINKIEFDYNVAHDFLWHYSYIENSNEIKVDCPSTYLINKAVRKVDRNLKEIKIIFNDDHLEISNIRINNDIYIYWLRIIAFTIIISTIILLFIYRKEIKKLETHILFVILSLVFGLTMILIFPKNVYTSFDDQIHFSHMLNPFRSEKINYSYAEQIVELNDITKKEEFFATTEEKLEYYRKLNIIHKETKDRVVEISNNRSLYGNLVYIPFYVGYRLSNALNLSFTKCFIIGKIFNLFLYSFLFYLAIKHAKYGKKVIFMIGLIPECLLLATQYSYDSTIIAGLVLATVCFINLIKEEKLNKKYVIMFILSTIWASLPKSLYCIFLLLLLFIPNKKFDSKKQAILFKVIFSIITALILITFLLPAATGQMTSDDRGNNTSFSGQMNYIMSNPISFIKTIFTYTITNIWQNTLGPRGFLDNPYIIKTSRFIILSYIYLVTLLYYVFTSKMTKEFNKKYKILFILEIFGIWLLFCAALYIKFTSVGSNSIDGIQPRYMLPLFAALLFLFMPKKDKEYKNNDYLYIVIPVLYISAIIVYVAMRFV